MNWISVNGRLPEHLSEVKVCRSEHGEPDGIALFANGRWFDIEGGEFLNVTHWCPLPQPPTDERS